MEQASCRHAPAHQRVPQSAVKSELQWIAVLHGKVTEVSIVSGHEPSDLQVCTPYSVTALHCVILATSLAPVRPRCGILATTVYWGHHSGAIDGAIRAAHCFSCLLVGRCTGVCVRK